MASNKKSYDGIHDHKQELKSGYRHSERFETNTCLNMTKEERSKWYHDWYWNRGGREQTLRRRRKNGFLKVGSLKPGKQGVCIK